MRRCCLLACVLLVGVSGGCRRAPESTPAHPAAAKVTAAIPETALATITLTPEAEKRLGIETASAERRAIGGTRTVGGEIVPAGGAHTTVTAPFTGVLQANARKVAVGAVIGAGEVVFTLLPLSSAERDVRIDADRQVAEAAGRQELAAKRAERVRQLVRDGSGSQRMAEEAETELVLADAALKAARDRQAMVSRGINAEGAIPLAAPRTAVLRALLAADGQTVSAGAPLFELLTLESVWLKVSLYAGELDTVDQQAPAEVVPLGATADVRGRQAVPVVAPPTADASTAGIDLFYSLPNVDRALRPGQRMSVRLPLRARGEHLVVPRSALLYDALGGTWVYEARKGGVFVRQRVSLADLTGETAVLQYGPPPGTPVVTVGAAELFGTEFGVGK